MALREVLKTRTSAANQKALTGAMEERNEKRELEVAKDQAREMVEAGEVRVLENVTQEDAMEE